MADNNDKNKKSIDVTKPRVSTPASNIDASKVSDYTRREQQSLEKLVKKLGTNSGAKVRNEGNIKTIIAIVLVVILIGISIAFVFVLNRSGKTEEADYEMRLSMQIENKSTLSIITESGKEHLREINPGDIIPLRASVKNSNDIGGDRIDENTLPPNIFVRFKLVLILDYEERYDIMIPTMTNRWYKYDKSVEDKLMGGVKEDDHYYYYLGSLTYMEPEILFSSIEFSGDAITCDDGGKYGQIQVHVESIKADIDNIVSRNIWTTAPQEWIIKMVSSQNSGNMNNNNTQDFM